ncbi:HlyD family efflux transporter periplasmic adaptor subunit [Paraburkholderia phenazinium]|jgi:membrane fusion protein (multidrug efflux system)|uniref:Membrane fusion protein, multidrug efflux system n=1 Tax=Paraburkholderia phenazinium TaxID=60549 RepID=A0A1G8B0E6_9BURK|nr:HlyD family efflux transporter periplasmic adaptor subunit [Paraburkholderia phenazinium]SDH26503.1 membrane fusion protein, multidrug efflux system [Paraburkholderia phenazinium]
MYNDKNDIDRAGQSQAAALRHDQDARRATRRRRLAVFLGVAAVVALVAIGWWFFNARFYEETDDAYVAGNIVQIAAQIPGTVTDILVDNTQRVKVGQALVKLDDTEASVAYTQAQAQLALAVRQVANANLSRGLYVEAIKARRAELALAQQVLAARDHSPIEIVAPEELARARETVAVAEANLASAQSQLDAARALGSGQAVEANPSVQQAAAQLRLAFRNLQRSTIVSPVDGTVGQRSVQMGQQVGPGVPLMSIIPLERLWVEANFKEGQIRHMRVGQPVRIVSDVYGSQVVYRGRVEGFSAGTGSAFSMLPSQNAAGNWIKVVQRVPIVISLDPDDLNAHPLRLGLSMQVSVDTHVRTGQLIGKDTPAPQQNTRVYEKGAGEAEKVIARVIRENVGL